MRAIDVMERNVITVRPDAEVAQAAKLLAEHDISAVPVVDEYGALVGILSEADLLHRAELGSEKRRPWWLEAITGASAMADEFVKSHGKKVGELMTSEVVSASEDASLGEIAMLLERHRIKRVPIITDGRLVGIVSRSNLVQALASGQTEPQDGGDDRQIRLELLERLHQEPWTGFSGRNVIVTGGVVHLWGLVGSPEERHGLVALAEGVPGVSGVVDEMISSY